MAPNENAHPQTEEVSDTPGGDGVKSPAPEPMEGATQEFDTWAQCDLCKAWRKLQDHDLGGGKIQSFECSMGGDSKYNVCGAAEELWDDDPAHHGRCEVCYTALISFRHNYRDWLRCTTCSPLKPVTWRRCRDLANVP